MDNEMSSELLPSKLLGELRRLADAAEAGDFGVSLDSDGLSPRDAEVIRLVNNAVRGYGRLAEASRVDAIEHHDALMTLVNQAAVFLLNADIDSFQEALQLSISIIAEAVNVDSVYLRKNHLEDGELYCSQVFEWLPDEILFDAGSPIRYSEELPGWEETLSYGSFINSIVRLMSPREQAHLSPRGTLSIFVTPIFINDEFWGFIGFDDFRSERVFSREETSVLYSASLIIANSYIRNEMIRSIRETSAQLEHAVKHANDASKAKSDFLAKMSHEIRTPMNAVIGMTELALREKMSVTAREHVITAKQAGVNLLAIINDILDFSKIESGDMKIVPVEYLLSSLMNDVISIIRMRVADSNLRFAVYLDSNLPNSLIGDETRIRQILINILGNAVKYTDTGYVAFKISGEMIAENMINLKLEVEDSGRGMKQEHLESLFDSYYQIDVLSKNGLEGVGLGLAITKGIVEAMYGDISVESEFGVGSKFTVTLPQMFENYQMLAIVESSARLSVLVYECREVYADSIVYAVSNLGVKCDATTDRAEFHSKIANGSYSFVFLSFDLYERSKEVILNHSGRFKLVLLTEFGQNIPPGDWGVLSVPVHAISVANLFNGVLDSFSYSSASNITARFMAPDARVLVVDDIKTNLKVASGLLAPYKMKIDTCDGGEEAVKAVKAVDYDLVFMDHRMPGVDGVEATKRIRALGAKDSLFVSLPIIALTANAVSGMKEMFLEEGFSDFLPKPIDTVRLNTVLEQWLPKSKQLSHVAEHFEADIKAHGDMIEVEGLNTDRGVRLSGNNPDVYFETLEVFCDDGADRGVRIRDCLKARDLELYTTYVHALKSAAANIGADRLSEMAYELEMAGQRGDLFYIEACNETFLLELDNLVIGIHAALEMQREDEAGIFSAPMDSVPLFEPELVRLRDALLSLNIRDMDDALDSLSRLSSSADEKSLVKSVSKQVLMGEYDDAVVLIERMLSEAQ